MAKLLIAYRLIVLLLLGYIAVQLTLTADVAEGNGSALYLASSDIASLKRSMENELNDISREIYSSGKKIVSTVETSASTYSCSGELGTALQKIDDLQETLDEIKARVNEF